MVRFSNVLEGVNSGSKLQLLGKGNRIKLCLFVLFSWSGVILGRCGYRY